MTFNNSILTQKVNVKEIRKQLSLLGYRKGDTVFLRGFLPQSHPDKKKDIGRKATVRDIDQLIKYATEWQAQERGVYLVVNGGGHTDKDIEDCRAIFYEHDKLSKEIQVDLWQSLKLPAPTFQIDTGGKSIHSYWVFETQINIDTWRQLQTDLLEYADADRSLKNPSRVMRLAGCLHGSGNESKIISESGNRYQFLEIRSIVPSRQQKAHTTNRPQNTIPLIDINDWGDMRKIAPYLEGYRQGGRKGWITCKCPVHGGQSDDSLHVNEATGQFHCHHSCDTKEIFKVSLDIAKNQGYTVSDFQKTHPTPVKSQESGVTNQAKSKTSRNELITKLSRLIDEELPKSELETLIPEIAEQTGRASSEIRRIYEALYKEKELEREVLEVKTNVPGILQAQQARLNPKELFWGDGGEFANLLQKVADAMPTSVENLITTLIPVAGSRMGTAAKITVKPSARFTQPAIFWSCVLAPTGRIKTPLQEMIISPLIKIEAEEFKKWQVAKEDFEAELKTYKKNSDSESPTPPPPRKRFLIQSATTETRIRRHCENPRGLLYYRDEWSSFITGRNKYRNGKGDDLEIDLSEFNGSAVSKDNSDESFFIERSAISRTGNTQPDTLKKILSAQNFEDYTGEFARWLFCLVPGEVAYIDLFDDGDDSGEIFDDYLGRIYRRIGSLNEGNFSLTTNAKKIFQSHHRWLTDAEINEPHPGLRATYPKLKSYLARFALWLHIFNAVLEGKEPAEMIEANTMYAATVLVDFYFNQGILLYGSLASGHSQGNHLTAELLKIKEYIEKHPSGRSAREIKYGVFCLRKCPKQEIEASLASLIELKIVSFDGNKYYPLEKKDHQDHHLLKTTAVQGIEGDDQRSSKDHQDHHFLGNFQESQNSTLNSVEKPIIESVERKTQDDLDDLLMIKDHQSQTLAQSDFTTNDDHDDLFLEKTEKNNQDLVGSTEVVQLVETALEYILPSVNAELLRECLKEMNWGMAQELTNSWDVGYRMDVWDCLTVQEKEAIRELEKPSPSPSPLDYDPKKIPLIKEKSIYWSKSKKCKVRVFIISATANEVQATVEGQRVPFSLGFSDLACSEESPVSQILVGDKVKILANGKIAKVSSIAGQVIYLRNDRNKSVKGEFYSHQLENT